jgi:hypothetical protein
VIYSPNTAVKMAAHKKRVLSENEMKCILEDSGSEFDDFFQKMKIVLKVKVKLKKM